jgi:hypothetical protein
MDSQSDKRNPKFAGILQNGSQNGNLHGDPRSLRAILLRMTTLGRPLLRKATRYGQAPRADAGDGGRLGADATLSKRRRSVVGITRAVSCCDNSLAALAAPSSRLEFPLRGNPNPRKTGKWGVAGQRKARNLLFLRCFRANRVEFLLQEYLIIAFRKTDGRNMCVSE